MLTRNRRPKKSSPPGTWKLQDAKTRFSEVVRKAQTEGPQRVTVHGKDAVVIVSASEYAKKQPTGNEGLTGAAFIDAMQQARKLGLRLKPLRYYPVYRPPVSFDDEDNRK
jgi:prevent-host-death family protein